MASSFNAKAIHRDGKAEVKIGLNDNNVKIIEGIGDEFLIKNIDGSSAKIAKENIIGMPESVSEKNKLVTQKDLQDMMKNIQDIIDATANLAKIVEGINEDGDK